MSNSINITPEFNQSYEILDKKNDILEIKIKKIHNKIDSHIHLNNKLNYHIFIGKQIIESYGYEPNYNHPLSLISRKNSNLMNDLEYLLDSKRYTDEIDEYILLSRDDDAYMEISDKLLSDAIDRSDLYIKFLNERIKIIKNYIILVKKGNIMARNLFVSCSNLWFSE